MGDPYRIIDLLVQDALLLQGDPILASDVGGALTLTNADGVPGSDMFVVFDTAGDDTIDASGLSSSLRVTIFSRGGDDKFIGGAGNDIFMFAASDLTSNDHVTGGAGFDGIQIISSGSIAPSSFANVSGIEALILSGVGNSVVLNNAVVAGSDIASFVVYSGAGNDVVDASAVTDGKNIIVLSNTGEDTFLGGAGNDCFLFDPSDLDSGDTIVGGSGFDILRIIAAGTIGSSAFANVSGVDALLLTTDGADVTLSDQLVSNSDNGTFIVYDHANNDTVDASGVTSGGGVAVLVSGTGATLTGSPGADYISFYPAMFSSADTIDGGSGFDILQFATSGSIAASAFDHVSGIDALIINGDTNVVIANALMTGADAGSLVIVEGTGNDTIDASAVTAGKLIVQALTGNDTFIGGAENDYFIFNGGDLTAADAVSGGSGYDFLVLNPDATIDASAFGNVTGIEALFLAGGNNSVTLSNGLVSGTGAVTFSIVDGPGNDLIDASAAGSGTTTIFYNKNGNDTYRGGDGRDNFVVGNTNFTSIDGNGGIDRLILNSAFDGQGFDLTANAAKLADIEVVSLDGASGVSLTVSDTAIAAVDPSGKTLYVLGGSDDELIANGDWHLVSANITNSSIAPGVIFDHYHSNATGADLFFQDEITTPPVGGMVPTASGPDLDPPAPADLSDDALLVDGSDNQAPEFTHLGGETAVIAVEANGQAISPFEMINTLIDDPENGSLQSLVLSLSNAPDVDAGQAFSGAFAPGAGQLDLSANGYALATGLGLHVTKLGSSSLAIVGYADEAHLSDLLHDVTYTGTAHGAAADYLSAFVTDDAGLTSCMRVTLSTHDVLLA